MQSINQADLTPYTAKNAPGLVRAFGRKFVRDSINAHIRTCCALIAMLPDGPSCEYVEVSEARTSKKAVVAFADFTSGYRLWIASDDLDRAVIDRWDAKPWLLTPEQVEVLAAFKVKYPPILKTQH